VLIILHQVETGSWAHRLGGYPAARLMMSGEAIPTLDRLPAAATLIVSRLNRQDVGKLGDRLSAEISPADLCRLPEGRVVVQQGQTWGTVDLGGNKGGLL
jgi:hypothetical protein